MDWGTSIRWYVCTITIVEVPAVIISVDTHDTKGFQPGDLAQPSSRSCSFDTNTKIWKRIFIDIGFGIINPFLARVVC